MNAESEMNTADGLGTTLEPPEGCTGAVMYDSDNRPSIQHDSATCPVHEGAEPLEWKLPDDDGDGATAATIEAIEDAVGEANALLATLDRQDRAGNGPAEAAHVIAQGVPREDDWRSAASFMEHVAATLDRFGVERPEHYRED